MSITKQNSLVEDALLQLKHLEEAVTENAKGILASTMKQEIGELVKESLGGSRKNKSYRSIMEQDQEGMPEGEPEGEEENPEMDDEEEIDVDAEVEDDGEEDVDVDMMASDDSEGEMEPLDMTAATPEEIAKVFKAMGDDDGIIIQKDGNYMHLSDEGDEVEYLIQMESDNKHFEGVQMEKYNTREETIYELEVNDPMEGMYGEGDPMEGMYGEGMYGEGDPMEGMYGEGDPMEGMYGEGDTYEVEVDNQIDDDMLAVEVAVEDAVYEATKPKGIVGKMKPFKYPSKLRHGVSEIGDLENEGDWNEEVDNEMVQYEQGSDFEPTESARNLGNGSRNYPKRKGLPKMRVAHGKVDESVRMEMNILREKNDEYKKALDFFRSKLNEVAVFNSNLAYATRIFTEHTTTKQEKINILRRFDGAESLKESKGLYKSIKQELDGKNNSVVSESITKKVIKTPTNGSATNLIESKTYENPQFLRMKDLMTKMK